MQTDNKHKHSKCIVHTLGWHTWFQPFNQLNTPWHTRCQCSLCFYTTHCNADLRGEGVLLLTLFHLNHYNNKLINNTHEQDSSLIDGYLETCNGVIKLTIDFQLWCSSSCRVSPTEMLPVKLTGLVAATFTPLTAEGWGKLNPRPAQSLDVCASLPCKTMCDHV